MAENRTRILELIEEIRGHEQGLANTARERAALEAASEESEEAVEARENAQRYWREREEELLDALNPQERRLDEAVEDFRLERTGPAADGLAVMVGHSRKSMGAYALSPPFPPALQAEEYHWNSELALQIKALADQYGIRCRIFYRDGYDIPGAYEVVTPWQPRATIELHFNSAGPGTQGTETWYGDESSIPWAAKLQARMVKLYGRKGRADRGTKDARIVEPRRAFTSTTQIQPSALIEPFFGSNLDDCEMAVERKPGLARAIIDAYAELAGIDLPGAGASVTPIAPAPQPVPVPPASSQPPAVGPAAANPSTPLPGLPESALIAALRHLYLAAETRIAHPGLKIVTLAQWALESKWGESGLAKDHFNFGGMKGIAEIGHLSDIASVVRYQAHDGWDRYLRFETLENFVAGYWRFMERSPYRGWKERAASEREFMSFISRKWAPSDPQYTSKVLDIAERIRRALAQATAEPLQPDVRPAQGGGTAPPAGGSRLSAAAIPADAAEFRKLFDLVTSSAFEQRALQGAVLAQFAIESNWGRSELARAHYNFAGIEWSEGLADLSVPVDYRRGDGTVGTYCRFLDYPTFIKAYFARLDRDQRFAGWKAKAADGKAFVEHVGPVWRPTDASYTKNVLGVLQRLAPQTTPTTPGSSRPSPAGQTGGATIPPGQVPDGYVIRISRRRTEQRRGAGIRTVGNYEVFFRGQKIRDLEGMVFETYGPGDNTATGTAYHRRVEAKTYPLGTHSSDGLVPKYATHGYTASTAAFAQSRPAIRLDKTGYRGGILMHPGGGFLSSIGCLNLSRPLTGPDDNIDYADSRERVVAIIEDMKARLGSTFPSRSWMTIPNAWMVIEGEPGQERSGGFGESLDVAREAATTRDAVSDADPSRLYAMAAAAMNGSVPGITDPARLQALLSAGANLQSLRSDEGENLWSAWADGIAAAAAIADGADQTRARRGLADIAALLKQSGVAIDDDGGLHTPLVRAAIGNQDGSVAALIEQGANVDAHDRLGLTPLIAAAFFGAADSVDILLANRANPAATVKAAAARADADSEVYAELPPEGSTALAAAEHGRRIVLYEPVRDAAFERIVAALTRG
jgi:flagellum-specific peptidoglycan hydrolase FlgJ/N-acetylmuramoyl-L-alanine amidase